MRILTRYVLIELTKVFLVSLIALTMVMLLVGVVREALQQNLPVTQVLQLLPYILPDALRVAVPVTLLLAATTVYGRLSGTNEVLAIKSQGISPMVLLWPAFVVATILSVFTVWLNDVAVSWGRDGARRVVVEGVEEIAYGMLRAQKSYSSSSFSITVRDVEGRRLIAPTLSLSERGNSPAMTVTADEAELKAEVREAEEQSVLKITLFNATLDVEGKLTVQFPDVYVQEVPLTDASKVRHSNTHPSTQPLADIPQQMIQQEERIARYKQQMAVEAAYQLLTGDFHALTGSEWERRQDRLAGLQTRFRRLEAEPHRRCSAGFSCLCFVLVGAPIAMRLSNRDFLTSFFLCFLPILIVYYPLLAASIDGAKSGTLPAYSVWAGNVLLALWGVWLMRRVIRY